MLTVEEPESHLHPTAQRAMAEEIHSLPGQVVASSHSPEFVHAVKGRLALLRTIDGSTSIQTTDSESSLLQRHPRAVFARALILAEGFEGRMLPYFARALGIRLHGSGIEVIDAGGQGNILGLWRFFGSPGLDLPTVCIADADNESDLNSFLKATGTGALPTTPNTILQALRQQDYFVCEQEECLEQELARRVPQHVDTAFLEKGESAFVDWRNSQGNQMLGNPWKKKLNATYVRELDDVGARAWRLSKWKEGPENVARLMTNDGNDAREIPDRFQLALQRAESLARAHSGTP